MEQLSFDGKKCRTPKLNQIFDLFPNIDKGLGKVKRGQLNETFQLSPTAERRGLLSNPLFQYLKAIEEVLAEKMA
tara:strand:+ start:11018 stop:11242 length:225 start_codon:yes stop_codon:yes gene_type:complete